MFYLNECTAETLWQYLNTQHWLLPEDGDRLFFEAAGHGNMNCTLRVFTEARSFILKQGRPWCERFPNIPAPEDRVLHEARFFLLAHQEVELTPFIPYPMGLDKLSKILCMQDLGVCHNLTDSIYQGPGLTHHQTQELITYLNLLHSRFWQHPQATTWENTDMRALQYRYLFQQPFRESEAIPLDNTTPGLLELAQAIWRNETLQNHVAELSTLYWEKGPSLLHGDFHPANWLLPPIYEGEHLAFIDFESSFFGKPEFEIGMLIGQLLFGEHNYSTLQKIREGYQVSSQFNWSLAYRFAGVEIIARLIGITQLPTTYELSQKKALLTLAEQLILSTYPTLFPTTIPAS